MSAVVTSVHAMQVARVRQEPYAFFFAPYVSKLDDTHHFTKTEWRLIAFAFGHLDYGQQFWDSSLAEISAETGLSRASVSKGVQRLCKLGVFYRQSHGGFYTTLYLSSRVAYRGKMRALKHFRQIEDAVHNGATYPDGERIDLEYQHAALGGVPDVTWPQWLFNHCMMPDDEDLEAGFTVGGQTP